MFNLVLYTPLTCLYISLLSSYNTKTRWIPIFHIIQSFTWLYSNQVRWDELNMFDNENGLAFITLSVFFLDFDILEAQSEGTMKIPSVHLSVCPFVQTFSRELLVGIFRFILHEDRVSCYLKIDGAQFFIKIFRDFWCARIQNGTKIWFFKFSEKSTRVIFSIFCMKLQ